MELSALPLEIISSRDAGTGQQIYFRLIGGAADALSALLEALPLKGMLSATDPQNADCALEARRTLEGFEIKRGCHGASGTWRQASIFEAISWLLPGTHSIEAQQFGLQLWIPR